MELRVRDVAKLLAVSEKKIQQWIREDGLPARSVNGQHRFHRAELLEWATARRLHVSPEIFQEAEPHSRSLPSLVQALEAGNVFHGVTARDKTAALRAVVQTLPLPAAVDRELLWLALLAREALQSTGVGEGIALPHTRNPVVLQVPCAMISLAFLAQPVEFAALDGKPVHALFTLISPTVRCHLYLLSRLAFALRDAGFKSTIARQGSRDEILNEARRVEAGLPVRSDP